MGDALLQALQEILRDRDDDVGAASELFDRRAEFLVAHRAKATEVQASVLDRYLTAFDALELSIMLCRSLADAIGAGLGGFKAYGERLADRKEPEGLFAYMGSSTEALRDLFQSGILVAGEVLTLLRSGYATGALARWRALHEITTRAEFIGAEDFHLETANRYLQHEDYRARLELQRWNSWTRRVNPGKAIPREQLRDLMEESDKLIEEYGEEFRGEYGWAEEALVDTSQEYVDEFERGKRKRGPIFRDLDHVIRRRDEDPQRLYWDALYSSASSAVHGSPRLIVTRDEEGRFYRRTGPYVKRLWEAGEATAHRLSDLARAFAQLDLPVEMRTYDVPQDLVTVACHLSGMAESTFAASRLQNPTDEE